MTFNTNINGVLLTVSHELGAIFGIYLRGSAENIRVLMEGDALDQIRKQIKAAEEFHEECQRKDESAVERIRMEAAMNRDSSDGPVSGDNGYTMDYDHDPEECDDPDCEEEDCIANRKVQEGDRKYDEMRDREMEEKV